MDGEEDVCDLILELGDRINSVEILVKARRAKLWYALLKNEHRGKEEKTHLGRLLLKEMGIPRPTDRQGQYEKDYDPGNMEPRWIERSLHTPSAQGKAANKGTNNQRWTPREDSIERRESLKNQGTASSRAMGSGNSSYGRGTIPMSSSKHIPSLYDRFMGQKREELEGVSVDLKLGEPSEEATQTNRYGGTLDEKGGRGQASEDF
jgi:hypothetical protein